MKFYGNGIVWDAERNRVLCVFENGEYDTVDEREIEILKAGGFDIQVEISEVEEVIAYEPKVRIQADVEGKVRRNRRKNLN